MFEFIKTFEQSITWSIGYNPGSPIYLHLQVIHYRYFVLEFRDFISMFIFLLLSLIKILFPVIFRFVIK